ncbi:MULTISPECIES: oligosaccharide flippase family protein [Pseudomonas]|uniref:oligosaccharide flippase family protein n=1 Tax=Pseudomonas TaxID=286 RepID=UPI0009DCAA2A|nr:MULTISPECIES: oligosaccharide flippase family protein [Pseudomonas]MBH3432024.1 oligosaccharide flippase family protein [Pseudomonas citronellolis]
MHQIILRTVRHRLFLNTLAAGVTQLSNFIPLLLVPFLNTKLGIETFGATAVALSLIQLSLVITDFGYTLSTTHKIAQNKQDTCTLNKIIGSVVIGKIPITLLAVGITAAFPLLVTDYRQHWELFTLAAIAIIGQSYQTSWLFLGLEEMKTITSYMLITKVAYLLSVILLVRSKEDAYIVILMWGLAQTLAAVLSIKAALKRGFKFSRPRLHAVYNEFREAIPFFASRIAVATYTSAAAVLVGISGQQQAAQFYACQQIYKIGAALPVNQVLYPYMAKNRNWKVFYKITGISGSIIALSALVASIYSTEILTTIFGVEFTSASMTFIVFLAATVLSYLAVAFGYPALSAVGALNKANSSVIIASGLNIMILLGLYTTNNLNALSTAAAILVTEATVLTLRIYFLKSAAHQKINS